MWAYWRLARAGCALEAQTEAPTNDGEGQDICEHLDAHRPVRIADEHMQQETWRAVLRQYGGGVPHIVAERRQQAGLDEQACGLCREPGRDQEQQDARHLEDVS